MWRRKKFLLGALLVVVMLVGTMAGVVFASGSGDDSASQPTVTGVVPISGVQGETLDMVVSGTNFTNATAVSFSGTGITVNDYAVDNDTQITADVSIARDATLGARDVSVTTANGTGTLSNGFTVQTRQEALLDRVCQIYENNTGVTINATQLEEAFTQARKEMQDEALKSWLQKLVDQGKITQDQMDQYLEWWQSRPDIPQLEGVGPGFGAGFGCHGSRGGRGGMEWGGGPNGWGGS